jgi:adenylylsulfate kinase-like enzyme
LKLNRFKRKCIHVDGDDIRDIFQNKDYSEEGRRKNIERAQTVAQFLNAKGYTVLVSLVSPYRDQREAFKQTLGNQLVEIYVHTTNDRGRNNFHVNEYQAPQENYIEIDTTDISEMVTYKLLLDKLKL